VVSLFHVLKLEKEYRASRGQPFGYQWSRPIISIGLQHALDGTKLDATYYHGKDGLGNVHELAPEYSCPKEHLDLFKTDGILPNLDFIPSRRHSYQEILDILKSEESGTVTICAIGPAMNIAKAAEIDPHTFARVRKVVMMGGAIDEIGNVTPGAEFNIHADPVAAARLFALSAKTPSVTLPKNSPEKLTSFPRQIEISLFPLDITHQHNVTNLDFERIIAPLIEAGSPLAKWIKVWMSSVYKTIRRLNPHAHVAQSLHDPLAVWYCITEHLKGWEFKEAIDVRVETTGEWTRGCTVVDKRQRAKSKTQTSSDHECWLIENEGNQINVAVKSPSGVGNEFGKTLLEIVFT
jgi:inosine-uridine nucleoside N-ribohydrolase